MSLNYMNNKIKQRKDYRNPRYLLLLISFSSSMLYLYDTSLFEFLTLLFMFWNKYSINVMWKLKVDLYVLF